MHKIRTVSQRLSATFALYALPSLLGLSPVAHAATTNLISLTTFEPDARPAWTYGYNYGYPTNPGGSNPVNSYYYDVNDVEFTNAMIQLSFDDTLYEDLITNNASAGFGVGFGGALTFNLDGTLFSQSDRGLYILSFDARVEGLTAGVTSAAGEMQARFDAPDDTILPPDGNGDLDTVLQVNIPFVAGSNWTHYVFTLNQGGIGGGSDASFAAYRTAISEPRFGCNLHMPNAAFGYDVDNAIYVDNIKLEVIEPDPAPVQPPTVEVVIADWNFDDKPAVNLYAYTYAGPSAWAGFSANAQFGSGGVGGSNGWSMAIDTSVFVDATSGTLQWAGAGTGCNGPIDASLFSTTNLSMYKLYVDAKVEGLSTEKSVTGAEMQFAIRAPDDTIQPPDGNGDPDTLLQANFNVTLQTNWQTFVLSLDKASVGGGSKALFNQHLDKISTVQPNFQITGASGDYGTDNDNVVTLDNLRLVRLLVGLPALTIEKTGPNARVTWSGPAKLQSAPALTGPWTDVPNATSPYTAAAADAGQYFRTQWVPAP
jgi:hypothetical protein